MNDIETALTPVGYLLGHITQTERASTVMAEDTPFFKAEVHRPRPALQGVGCCLVPLC